MVLEYFVIDKINLWLVEYQHGVCRHLNFCATIVIVGIFEVCLVCITMTVEDKVCNFVLQCCFAYCMTKKYVVKC